MAAEKPTKREIPRAYQTGRRSGSYSTKSDRSSSDGNDESRSSETGWPWDRHCVLVARALVLTSIVYAAWRYGGVDASGKFHVSVMLGFASVLTLAARRSFSRKSRRLPVMMFSIALSWIAFAFLQATPIASPQGFVFLGSSSVKARIADPALSRLNSAIEQIDDAQVTSRHESYPSVVPYQTRQALVPYQIAFVALVLSSILFESRQSRLVYLWVLIVNTSFLSAWGIVQRAGGDAFILPGIANTFSNAPFSSFIYKNAGAAAILPGFAAIAALMYGRRSGQTQSRSSAGSSSLGHGGVFLLQPINLTLIALVGLLTTGLIASLSRGAWMTFLAASIIVFIASRFQVSKKQLSIIAISTVLLIASMIALTGIRDTISLRANQVSVETFSRDERWGHWKDGAQAAWFYAPGGSGLGTYGYSTLPVQTQPHRSWFREAHNQYVEILVEMGIVGFTLLMVVIGWFAMTSWKLLRQDSQREKSSWGLVGLAVLLCGAIQSTFDFVLLMPANMMLYASLIGVVAAAERSYAAYLNSRRDQQSYADGTVKDPIRKTEMRYSLYRMPAIWVVVGLGMIGSASFVAYRHEQAEAILDVTRSESVVGQPSRASIDWQLKWLNEAIELQPERADLYRRRANLKFTQYRLLLIELAKETGEDVDWDDTRPETLAATLAAVDETSRTALLEQLQKTPEMQAQIASSLKDLAKSLQRNPLDPVTHATCLYLAPLTGMPLEPWIRSYARLNNNDVNSLYANGLMAFQYGLTDWAIDQWSKALSVNQQYIKEIHDLAPNRLTTTQIAESLIPPNRPDLFVQLIDRAEKQSPMLAEDVREELIAFLTQDGRIAEGEKQAALGAIAQRFGDRKSAIEHWKRAVEHDSKNADYRWNLAEVLRQNGQYEESLQQSILGGTLHPDDFRFENLTLRIRQDIYRQTDFD